MVYQRNRSPEVLQVVPMTAKRSGDSTLRVSGIIFAGFRTRLRLKGSPVTFGRFRAIATPMDKNVGLIVGLPFGIAKKLAKDSHFLDLIRSGVGNLSGLRRSAAPLPVTAFGLFRICETAH